MTVQQLIETERFQVVTRGNSLDIEISEPFCCDLLSIAMSKAPERGVWVTVMGNINTLAVTELTEVACIILAEGAALDEMALSKAEQQGTTVLCTKEPIFVAALAVHDMMHD